MEGPRRGHIRSVSAGIGFQKGRPPAPDRGADDWDETKHIKAGRTVTKADVTETPVTKTDVTETADNGNDGGVLPDRPEGRSRPRYSNASANLEMATAHPRIRPCLSLSTSP